MPMRNANEISAPFVCIGAAVGCAFSQAMLGGISAMREQIDLQRLDAWGRIDTLVADRDDAVHRHLTALSDHEDADAALQFAAAAIGIKA